MRNFTAAVPAGKLLILDMRTECESLASRTDSLYGTPFIWEVMDDFGGTNGMFGDIGLVRDQLAAASADLSGANLTTLGGWVPAVDSAADVASVECRQCTTGEWAPSVDSVAV
jgi:alpha-N-acetylglucosaminidase